MQLSHAATVVDVAFDDPNLIADAGLVPMIALAEQVGLPVLVEEHDTITGVANSAGANPGREGDVPGGWDGLLAQIRSRMSTGCVTPATLLCSTRSALPRLWVASCARSPTGMCSS